MLSVLPTTCAPATPLSPRESTPPLQGVHTAEPRESTPLLQGVHAAEPRESTPRSTFFPMAGSPKDPR